MTNIAQHTHDLNVNDNINNIKTDTSTNEPLTTPQASDKPIQYQDILSIVAEDFTVMDEQVFGSLNSKVQLVMNVSQHVINAGGKRMRPLITLLCSRMLNDVSHKPAMHLAAITEMLHTATLVHDDVIDESGLRRGKPTANATWNNPIAVLVGDYLIARAFNLLVDFKNFELLEEFSAGTCDIAEGEVLQLQHQHDPHATESDYMRIIDGKTSRLFMMATQGAAILHDMPEHLTALKQFGQHFGNAFQIIDDVLDYTGSAEVMGKNMGDDLAEGKPTLPTIKALTLLKENNQSAYQKLYNAIKTGKTDNEAQLTDLISLVQTSGALTYCQNRALEETHLAQQALDKLPKNRYRDGLMQLTQMAISRLV